jgi:N-acetylglucosaminyldiphosphoundecaprenol N-acetyl-beta-D-mannosaminyltransferase
VDETIPAIDILGVRLATLTPRAALETAERLYDSEKPAFIAHVNAHTLNLAYEDPSYRDVLASAGLVLNDGKGVMLGARLLGGAFPADLNGNFFTPLLLRRAAQRGWPVFLYGARPGIAARAAEVLRSGIAGLQIAGVMDGYERDRERVLGAIRRSGAGLLLVALGNPLQERWLAANLAACGARLGSGVGAFFDFQAGEVARAPEWMNRLGLEWVYRLGREPRRMWRRYVLGNPLFLARVLRQRRAR